ncbi:MAG: RNB domain-containing ribonuclease [Spirochaetales bacterium]|nr:RNB domain-containing ribonuclease [Spirochaetales bacterium]
MKEKSLVLYKQSPALVKSQEGEKITITLPKGEKKVRQKDILLLHEGPLSSLGALEILEGDPADAWELFQGEQPSLEDLAELIYGEYSPSAAWSVFMLLNRTAWFKGTVDKIEVTTAEEREKRESAAREKEEAAQRWADFLSRLKKEEFQEEDEPWLREVEQMAQGYIKRSAVLSELKKDQTPENAHKLLIKWNRVEPRWNPYPPRFGCKGNNPDLEVPPLPEEERTDLTHFTSYAIDDEGNTDPDDAVGWDGEKLWVHIADAAALVSPDSPLDLEARDRGANLYIPEKTITMLPPGVTEQLGMGLQEDRSPAFSFGISLNEDGSVDDVEIKLSWVKVERLTYAQADTMMEQEPFRTISAELQKSRDRRMNNGAREISLPEVKLRVEEEGKGEIRISPLPRLKSRDMVAESMMLTGNAAASFAISHNIPVPFVSQPTPENNPQKLEGLAGEYAKRKIMQRSRVTLSPSKHSGLGMDVYTRVTSPLRRYSDLMTMQQLRAYITGGHVRDEEDMLEGTTACESLASQVTQAERASNQHWKINYLLERPDWRGEAIMVDRTDKYGVFLIPELAMEPRISLKEPREYNSKVSLKVQSADLPERRVVFALDE